MSKPRDALAAAAEGIALCEDVVRGRKSLDTMVGLSDSDILRCKAVERTLWRAPLVCIAKRRGGRRLDAKLRLRHRRRRQEEQRRAGGKGVCGGRGRKVQCWDWRWEGCERREAWD